ncbi:hypothetical protein AURDEDRAFT_128749, partial [Auricularia subglabra TFB-10046 SS5]
MPTIPGPMEAFGEAFAYLHSHQWIQCMMRSSGRLFGTIYIDLEPDALNRGGKSIDHYGPTTTLPYPTQTLTSPSTVRSHIDMPEMQELVGSWNLLAYNMLLGRTSVTGAESGALGGGEHSVNNGASPSIELLVSSTEDTARGLLLDLTDRWLHLHIQRYLVAYPDPLRDAHVSTGLRGGGLKSAVVLPGLGWWTDEVTAWYDEDVKFEGIWLDMHEVSCELLKRHLVRLQLVPVVVYEQCACSRVKYDPKTTKRAEIKSTEMVKRADTDGKMTGRRKSGVIDFPPCAIHN